MEHAVRDAHTHFFSRVFFETLARQAPDGRPAPELLAALADRTGLELPSDDPMELQLRWVEEMEVAGVDSMVTFASVPEEAEVVSAVARSSGGRLAGYTVVNPVAPGADAFAERALGELGLHGLVLFPALHHYHVGDEVCRPVLERLRDRRGVCVVHCGILRVKPRELLGLPTAYDARYANPLALVRAAWAYPEVSFVVPHFGAGMLRETLLAAAWAPNVLLDTSSSNEWIATQVPRTTLQEVFEHALEVLGPRRILFGTDSSSFPRGYRKDVLDTQRAVVDLIGLPDVDRQAIFGGNLARLLGIGDGVGVADDDAAV